MADLKRERDELGSKISNARDDSERKDLEIAPNHHLRAAIVPATATATATDPPSPVSRRRLDWASLLRHVFATDVLVCDT